jgi:hypothetical protein
MGPSNTIGAGGAAVALTVNTPNRTITQVLQNTVIASGVSQHDALLAVNR